jgi:Glycerophosphoryl diester phosphodiesterase family
VHLCECDIALTKDEKLILSHDEDFYRLALNKNAPASTKKIHELTFKELLSLPLTSAARPPLLIDILRSACAIGDNAQLAIEIKPGNEVAVTALTRMLAAYPEFMPCIACIMSFDAYTMHQLRRELWSIAAAAATPPIGPPSITHTRNRSRSISFSTGLTNLSASPAIVQRKQSIAAASEAQVVGMGEPLHRPMQLPKLMMLTVEGPPKTPCKLRVGIHDLSPLESSMVSADGTLDGVYLEYQPAMLEPEGLAILRKLSETYCVGVWNRGGEPDNYQIFRTLIHEGNVTFVNTDLPDTFRADVPAKRGHKIRRMQTA